MPAVVLGTSAMSPSPAPINAAAVWRQCESWAAHSKPHGVALFGSLGEPFAQRIRCRLRQRRYGRMIEISPLPRDGHRRAQSFTCLLDRISHALHCTRY